MTTTALHAARTLEAMARHLRSHSLPRDVVHIRETEHSIGMTAPGEEPWTISRIWTVPTKPSKRAKR